MGVAILGADGRTVRTRQRIRKELSIADAQTLRSYKRFLQRHGYKEGRLYCEHCQVDDEAPTDYDGAALTGIGDEKIGIVCNCRELFYLGRTL